MIGNIESQYASEEMIKVKALQLPYDKLLTWKIHGCPNVQYIQV